MLCENASLAKCVEVWFYRRPWRQLRTTVHKCKNTFDLEVKLGRLDECPHCGADLHCCKNCKYWDIKSYNECTEHIAEYIPDREKANFCGMFTYREGASPQEPDMLSARAKLDALFKK